MPDELLYFAIGVIVSTVFFITPLVNNILVNIAIKKIIKSNVQQIKSVYDRLYADMDRFDGTEADITRAAEMGVYFEKKMPTLEAVRTNIQNQLAHLHSLPFSKYTNNVRKILLDLDTMIEACYAPKLPTKYQCSIWRDKQDVIRSKVKNTMQVSEMLKV